MAKIFILATVALCLVIGIVTAFACIDITLGIAIGIIVIAGLLAALVVLIGAGIKKNEIIISYFDILIRIKFAEAVLSQPI